MYPLELQPIFYRFEWAWPAHATWTNLITILGGGCVNRLHITLPIIASYLVVGKLLSALGNWKRAKDSWK